MPRSPWQPTHPWATAAPSSVRRDRLPKRRVLQATSVAGSARALLVGCGAAGGPAAVPTALQTAVKASTPAARPCTTGRIRKPNTTEKASTEMIATLAQRRQGLSRASGSAGVIGSPRPVDAMHDRLRRLQDEELRDRIAIGRKHQHEHQHVPERKAVEARGNAQRRGHRAGGTRLPPRGDDRPCAVEFEQVPDEE